MRPLSVPIGIDDFRKVRELGLEYVDKTGLIREILDRPGTEVFLIPRPRRFGKTLNLSMLRCWFEKQEADLSPLFEGLSIWQAGAEYRAHFQRYPVIHFNFKGSKGASLSHALSVIRKKLGELFDEHRYLLDSDRLSDRQRHSFRAILEETAAPAQYEGALLDLSACLHAHHGEKVVILIDEYDEPIHAGHVHGYAAEILDFMRNLLGEGLKSNVHLHKAVVTGILRVAKENLFSGLNNLGVYTLLRGELSTCFGFTEAEVAALLERHARADRMAEVRQWYNGYLFGGEVVYNPWSVLCFLDSRQAALQPYWLSTSSNDLVRELLELHSFELQPVFESLLQGGGVEVALEDNVVLAEIRKSPAALWSLLVFSGYLKAEAAPPDSLGNARYRLSIPNHEVRGVYSTTFRGWMDRSLRDAGGSLPALTRALLAGDAETFEEELQAFVTNVLSYHDPGKLRPERVYHGFLVGLLAVLEPGHQVRSNRESGKGRPDVLIRPTSPGKPGVVLELKVAKPGKKTLDQALAEGLAQLRTGDHTAELRASGAAPVHQLVVAFDGKVVRVHSAAE
ncbi:MAG: AAA family ATPase [Polyangiaceae bacterium]